MLCKEESRIDDFLVFSYEMNKHPWCDDSEEAGRDLKFSNSACTGVRFLLPIIEDFKKENISKEEKKKFINRCLKFPKVFLKMFNLYS